MIVRIITNTDRDILICVYVIMMYVCMCYIYMYIQKSKIGSGSFGEIFLGLNESNNESVAIKVEKANTKYPQLYDEFKMYKSIPSHQGVPNIYWFGQVGNFNIMIMEILGASLEKLFNKCHRKFTLKTVLMLGIQLVSKTS